MKIRSFRRCLQGADMGVQSFLKERFHEFKTRWRRPDVAAEPARIRHWIRGKSGEAQAYRYLRKMGYRIVARNYRKTFGEIDLIGWEKDILVFIEVKLRSRADHGLPQDAVNLAKQRQIARVAKEYRTRYRLHDINYRFDIVSIQGNPGQERIDVVKDAFKDLLNT
ncbi:MAG: YraN family protein [Terriglobia bacterium]